MDQGERGRSYAGKAAGLADGHGANALESFAHLAREAADGVVLKPAGDGDGLGGLEALDGFLLLLEVASEFDFGFDGAGLVAKSGAGDGGSDSSSPDAKSNRRSFDSLRVSTPRTKTCPWGPSVAFGRSG